MVPLPSSFLVWGSGGHGRVVADLVRATGHRVVRYVDHDPSKLGQKVEAGIASVFYLQDELQVAIVETGLYPEMVVASALGIRDNSLRERCLQTLADLHVPPLVHSSAAVSPSAQIGRGSVIFRPRGEGRGVMLSPFSEVERWYAFSFSLFIPAG